MGVPSIFIPHPMPHPKEFEHITIFLFHYLTFSSNGNSKIKKWAHCQLSLRGFEFQQTVYLCRKVNKHTKGAGETGAEGAYKKTEASCEKMAATFFHRRPPNFHRRPPRKLYKYSFLLFLQVGGRLPLLCFPTRGTKGASPCPQFPVVRETFAGCGIG